MPCPIFLSLSRTISRSFHRQAVIGTLFPAGTRCGSTTIAIMTIAVHSQPTNGVRGDGMVTTKTQSG